MASYDCERLAIITNVTAREMLLCVVVVDFCCGEKAIKSRHEKSGNLGDPGSRKIFRDCGNFVTKITCFMCGNLGVEMKVWKQKYQIVENVKPIRISNKLKTLIATINWKFPKLREIHTKHNACLSLWKMFEYFIAFQEHLIKIE